MDLEQLSFPSLTGTRHDVLTAVQRLCRGPKGKARTALGLGPTQDDELTRNQQLLDAPTAPAAQVYTGVLYDALGYPSLPVAARRRLDQWVVISSALWGALRLTDAIPAYRLSGDVTLPRIGKVSTRWRDPLATVLPALAGDGLVLDLRSGAYAAMWSPVGDVAARTVAVRVLQRRPDGTVKVVSHHNKATKGRLLAALSRRGAPRTLQALSEAIASTGVDVDLTEPARGRPGRLDVVTDEL